MPISSRLKISDPDQFKAALRPTSDRFTITGRGPFSAQITQVAFADLMLQRGDETLSRTWNVCVPADRIALTFVIAGTGLSVRGVLPDRDEALVLPPGLDTMHTLYGPTVWGAMSLPPDRLTEQSVALTGRDWTPPGRVLGLKARPAPLTRLQRLHASVTRLAETTPALLAHPNVARGLEQAVIEAFVGCLDQADYRAESEPFRRRTQVMKRFRDFVECHADEGLFVSDAAPLSACRPGR